MIKLQDGLYRVETKNFCAGFVIEQGKLVNCAPILRRDIEYWKRNAKRISNDRKRN